MLLAERELEDLKTEMLITLEQIDDAFIISIDGVKWVESKNQIQAYVIYAMMADHIVEYVLFPKTER